MGFMDSLLLDPDERRDPASSTGRAGDSAEARKRSLHASEPAETRMTSRGIRDGPQSRGGEVVPSSLRSAGCRQARSRLEMNSGSPEAARRTRALRAAPRRCPKVSYSLGSRLRASQRASFSSRTEFREPLGLGSRLDRELQRVRQVRRLRRRRIAEVSLGSFARSARTKPDSPLAVRKSRARWARACARASERASAREQSFASRSALGHGWTVSSSASDKFVVFGAGGSRR